MTQPQQGCVIWFTGLPGAGKTTLCRSLLPRLEARGFRVEHLDGDVVRKGLCQDLGFTPEDRETNLHRVAFVAQLLAKHGVIVLCSFVSPYRKVRRWLRGSLTNFVEVHVDCSVAECTRRDPKGMYAKALRGEIERFTGISAPYEDPEHAEIVVDTEHQEIDESVQLITGRLEALGVVAPMMEEGSNVINRHPGSRRVG